MRNQDYLLHKKYKKIKLLLFTQNRDLDRSLSTP